MPLSTEPEGTTPEGYRPGEPGLRRASMALFLAGVVVFALLYAPQPLLPTLATDFSVGAGASTLAISCSTAALAIGLLVAGPASERFGRTPLVHGSLITSSVLALACAAAPTWPALVVARTLEGLALAGLPAVAVAYLREEVHADASGRATGLYVAGNAIGGMVGRLASSGLAELGGWRTAVGGTAALCLLTSVAVLRLLPASRRFVAAPAGLRALARRSAGVLRDPALLALYGIAATLMGAFVAVYNTMGFRLEAAPYHLRPGVAGLVFLSYAVGSLASAKASRWAEAIGRRVVVPLAVLVMTAGALLTLAAPLALVVAGLVVLTAGFFGAHGVASGWVAARAALGGRATAQATSTYLFAYYAGSSVGGSLGGAAWARSAWPGVAVVVLAGVLTALALSLALARTASLLPLGSGPPPAPLRRGRRARPPAPPGSSRSGPRRGR